MLLAGKGHEQIKNSDIIYMIKLNRKKEAGLQKIHMVSCSRCGRIHPRGQCPRPATRSRSRGSETRTDAQRFRSSRTWQRKAEEVKERDKHLCRLCLYNGVINFRELSVHHITPINEAKEKRLDNDNLITLCNDCHVKVEGDDQYTDLLRRLAISPPGLK